MLYINLNVFKAWENLSRLPLHLKFSQTPTCIFQLGRSKYIVRFESDIFQRVGVREAKKHRHRKTHRIFSENFVEISLAWSQSQQDFVTVHLEQGCMREMQWKMHQSLKQPAVLNFELMLILLMRERNKGNEKLLRGHPQLSTFPLMIIPIITL